MQNKCILFSFFSRIASYLNISVISQDSAAAYLRRGGMYYVIIAENIVLFQTVKEFGKWVKMCQS